MPAEMGWHCRHLVVICPARRFTTTYDSVEEETLITVITFVILPLLLRDGYVTMARHIWRDVISWHTLSAGRG